jgi:hypothetical protein
MTIASNFRVMAIATTTSEYECKVSAIGRWPRSTQSDDHPSPSLAAIGMSSWKTFQGTNSSASSRANPKEPNAMPPLQIEPLLAAAVVACCSSACNVR